MALDPNSFTARRRPRMRAGVTQKVTFELKTEVHDMLRAEARRVGMTQVYLLEKLIQHFCDPERVHASTL